MNTGLSLQWFVYQQDYLWFLTAMGWAALIAAWWRLGRTDKALAWLPWAALAAFLTASQEVAQLITPVVQKPFAAPWLREDLTLGGIHALLAGGLWWTLARQLNWRRWKIAPVLALAILAAWLHYSQPLAGSVALTLLVLAPAWWLARALHAQRAGWIALLSLPAAVLLASNGPVAEWLHYPHRYTEISPFGLTAAGALLVSLVAAGRKFYLRAGESPDSVVTHADLLLLVWVQALWLALGLVLAAIMGHWARASFESNLLARVRMGAELIDRKYLAANVGPGFRVDEIIPTKHLSGIATTFTEYRSDYLARKNLPTLAETLAVIELANADVDWAMIITMRGGLLVQYYWSSRMPALAKPGVQGSYGRPDAPTWEAWSERRPQVLAPVTFHYGTVVQARAPLISSKKEMLGWLIFDLRVAYWLGAQIQARLLAFLVVGLGSILLAVSWQLRVRERVRATAQRDADVALAANRLKSSFLAKVSHELRTPIQSLLGYSEMLHQHVAGDPKAARWLASLQQHGELMTRLVNDLIDLSAVEAGAFQLASRPVEPANVLTQTVESFRPQAEARNLTLATFVDASVPAWVFLDGERFRQILTNLVGNALKFTDRGGVTISLRAEPGGRLVLMVRDTGPGIPPAEQARLFVAFSRLELTSAKEGTGLGLALSSALCRAMGGDLTVMSDGVTGSCFTATLRAPETVQPDSSSPIDPPATLRGHRVLVVDDNPLVRELFIAFLTEQGAQCASASSGAEAIAQAGVGTFDAIVLDLALPDGDGVTFVQPLLQVAANAKLVGVSAHASSTDRARALAAGMESFLTKPVPLATLAAAVSDQRSRPTGNAPLFRTADALRERLARQFTHDLPGQRAEFAKAIIACDWPRVCALAHNLKNSAVVVRDDALFDVCTGLEQAAAARDEAMVLLWWARCPPHFERWSAAASTPLSSVLNPGDKPKN